MPQSPSVGHIVHIGVAPVAALITRVNPDETVDLTLFLPDGTTEGQADVPHSETPSDTAWNWPPFVAAK
jgi:hypothetical protein